VTTSGPRRPLAVRLYGALTGLLPGALGRHFAGDATDLFEDLHRDAVRTSGQLGGWLLWARSAVLLISCAVGERRDAQRRTRWRTTPPPTGGGHPMGALLQDLRFGARALAKRPAFAATAILILAAGIGAATTIFSVVDTVVLRELPYPDAGRLVHFDNGDHSYPSLRAWLAMPSFETLAAVHDVDVDLTQAGTPERLRGEAVSAEFFRMFGGAPYLGRLFDSGDYPGDRSVVVLDHGFWRRYWGGDPGLIGQTLRLDGEPAVVIGVLDPGFRLPESATGQDRVDVWFPLDDGGDVADHHGMSVLNVVGRLRPGVSLESAQAEVDAQRHALAEELPSFYKGRDGSVRTTPLTPLREATVRGVRSTLLMLLGAVGLLLLIACANVANLFLAHGTARAGEIALRGALGASRARIAAQVLTESVMLALAGGALGVALAFGGVTLFARYSPGGIPRIDALAVDLRVLAFSVSVAVATGVLFGVLPALQAVRADVSDALKDRAASVTAGRGARRARSGLVVAEIALAVVLVTGAGLLMRSFVARIQADPGFDAAGLAVVGLSLGAGYDETTRLQFVEELLDRVDRLPAIRATAAGWASPFKRTGSSRCCWRDRVVGDPALVNEDRPFLGMIHPVTPSYFRTLGASVAHGREFTATDGDPPVAILNRLAAQWLFGTDQAVGRTITIGSREPETLEVVGVVQGVHEFGPTEGAEEAVYVPYARYGTATHGGLDVVVRSEAAPETLAEALREAVWGLDPNLPILEITTMERRISGSLARSRFLSGVLGVFAAVALLLACGGIYGSMLYSVGQRRREMGIRLALGANGSDVVRLVLRQGLALTVAGVVLGTVSALALSGVMEQLVWGVEPTDPLTFAVVAVLLGSTATTAALVPAWRAGRTDPLQTLRAE
jgi:predicted permease